MAKTIPPKPVPLSSDDLLQLASTLYGREQTGYQTKLARDLGSHVDRNITPAQVSIWISPSEERGAPAWATIPAYLALMAASDELCQRAIACRNFAEGIRLGHLAKISSGDIRSKMTDTGGDSGDPMPDVGDNP